MTSHSEGPGPNPDQRTQEMPAGGPPPQQQPWGPGGYPGYAQGGWEPQRQRPRMQVRSTFLTTEFWVLVVLSVAILVAAALVEDRDGLGFGASQAWKYVTWLGIAYMLSRGLTKLGGSRREGGDPGKRV